MRLPQSYASAPVATKFEREITEVLFGDAGFQQDGLTEWPEMAGIIKHLVYRIFDNERNRYKNHEETIKKARDGMQEIINCACRTSNWGTRLTNGDLC